MTDPSPTLRLLEGDWYDEGGYHTDRAAWPCYVVEGKAYDAESWDHPCGAPHPPPPIRLVAGVLYWPMASFIPDAGELARIGLA